MSDPGNLDQCTICGKTTSLICSRCRSVSFCSIQQFFLSESPTPTRASSPSSSSSSRVSSSDVARTSTDTDNWCRFFVRPSIFLLFVFIAHFVILFFLRPPHRLLCFSISFRLGLCMVRVLRFHILLRSPLCHLLHSFFDCFKQSLAVNCGMPSLFSLRMIPCALLFFAEITCLRKPISLIGQ